MSRQALRTALQHRDPGRRAVVPLIGRHAARLEGIAEAAFLTDPESQARALRNAQALYATDAVTIGAGADSLATAARLAVEPTAAATAARAAERSPLATRPDAEAVLGQAVIQSELEAIRRLRPVLGERAGIAVILPSPDRLAVQLADPAATAWAQALLMRAVRAYGELEPDLLITVGATDPTSRLAPLCDHFGLAHIHLGANLPGGVAVLPGDAFAAACDGREWAGAWLVTTGSEIPTEADAGAVKDAVARLRA